MATKTLETFDPYDLWSTRVGVNVRDRFYQGRLSGKIGAVSLGLLDWLTPQVSRRMTQAQTRRYPIVIAHEILRLKQLDQLDENTARLLQQQLANTATDPTGETGWSWGLGFPWMSKNGLYPDNLPFVTHTPYVMEALLILAEFPSLHAIARQMFLSTWDFLQSLKVMQQNDTQLALSYAPVDEPRIVINANSYAAYAYAMHAIHGAPENRDIAIHKAHKLLQWVIGQQHNNGSWDYYADNEAGNFIDCFHSCFVVKNLYKTQQLLAETRLLTHSNIFAGWKFIQDQLYDKEKGLCRRFVKKNIKDPYVWDLYDQAEFLSLLVKFGELDHAHLFEKRVRKYFSIDNDWYCKVDMFGRRWGKNFQRWGIAPFHLAQSQLGKRSL